MSISERCLLQVRITPAQKGRIKSLAARQHITIEKAVVEAFDAWAEKLRAPAHDQRPARPTQPASPAQSPAGLSPASPARGWVELALHLDWTQCPEVELLEVGSDRLWMLRATDAPLPEVLRALADGHPVARVAEIFDLELPHLLKVIQFVDAAQSSGALN